MHSKRFIKILIIIYIILFPFHIYSSELPVYMNEKRAAKLRVDKEKILENIKEDPNDARYHNELSMVLRKLGEEEDALKEANIAIGIDLNKPSYLNNRALIYMQMEKYEAAIDDLNKIIGIDPEIPSVYINLSVIYRNKGEYDKAIEYCKKALKIRKDKGIFFDLALLYKDIGEYEKSRALLDRVIFMSRKDSYYAKAAQQKIKEIDKLLRKKRKK